MPKYTFIYWNVASRAQLPQLLLSAGNVDYTVDTDTANAWPTPKKNMPFGQLPVLRIDNGADHVLVAQSGAIARYCAQVADLLPTDPVQQAIIDSIMEHANDIFGAMAKAKYAGDEEAQKEGWKKFGSTILPEKLAYLETMASAKTALGTEKPNAADVAVFSVLNLVERAGVEWKQGQTPNLEALCDSVKALGNIPNYLSTEQPPYFKVA